MNEQAGFPNGRLAVDVGILIARVIVGTIFVLHGAQKLFGAFGGPGLEAIVAFLGPVGYLVSVGEFFGGLGLIFGFLTRFSAAANIVTMIGAIQLETGKNGFFLGNSPEATLAHAGYEYNLALIGLLAPIMIGGPGRFSVGRALPFLRSRKTRRPILILD